MRARLCRRWLSATRVLTPHGWRSSACKGSRRRAIEFRRTPEDYRDLPLAPGRGAVRGPADRVRATDGLPVALPVLRHRLRLSWRGMVDRARYPRAGGAVWRPRRVRDRRRATGAAPLPDAAARLVRPGLPGLAGDQRRVERGRGRSA